MVSRDDEPVDPANPDPASPETDPKDPPLPSGTEDDLSPKCDPELAEARDPWADIIDDLGPLGELRLPDPATARSGRDWDGTEQIDAAEREVDGQEHFVPPEPPPILGGDPLLTMAWFAALGIPAFWLVLLLLWPSADRVVVHASIVVFVAGVAVLFWRMPHRRDPDDDETGAVV
ncbi:MAG: hypothetical protein FWF02_13505 [Micrococcales bacterium]|nr:hypothetical protein [Micrococcales bacterium]MCL2668693.1 hypothetical protein [Micrococcales bacterium]